MIRSSSFGIGRKNTSVFLIILGVITLIGLNIAYLTEGIEAVVWPVMLIGGMLVFVQPFWGTALMLFTIPLESMFVLGGNISLTRVLGLVVFGGWIAHKLVFREDWKPFLSSQLFKLSFALAGLAVMSMLWALYPDEVLSPTLTLVQMIGWGLLLIDMGSSWDRIDRMVKWFLISALVAALLTNNQYFITGELTASGRAGKGITGGANSTAMTLVSALPFAFYLLRNNNSTRFWKLFGLSYLIIAFSATVVMFSRTSYLLFAFIFFLELMDILKLHRNYVSVLLLSIIIGLLVIVILPKDKLFERLQTIIPEIQGSISMDEDTPYLESRGYILKVGFAIFSDYPLLGAGYGGFGRNYMDYQFRVPGAKQIIYGERSPHNSYVNMLSELGIVGFLIWTAILFASWKHISSSLIRLGQVEGKLSRNYLIAQAILYGLLVQFGYGLARPIEQEKLLWFILGLCFAVYWVVNQDSRQSLRVKEPINFS